MTPEKKRAVRARKPPRSAKKPGPLARCFRLAGFALGFVLCAGGGLIALLLYWNSPPGLPSPVQRDLFNTGTLRFEDDRTVFIEVRPGESSFAVGQRLEKAGVIRSRYFWNLLSRYDGEFVKTGMYRFEFPAPQLRIRSLLVAGREILARVTVPEGVTLKKIASLLEEAAVCDGTAFLEAASDPSLLAEYRIPGLTMEGYLYPDTYLFPAAWPARQVVRAMADNFWRRLENVFPGYYALSPEELNKKVILASIVEREYRVDDEAPLMAGVFYNRLSIGMALQSCATVEYVITEIQGKPHPRVLYDRDTAIPDPYNTYARAGLPPGPISAPGHIALEAAFYPVESDYLYFRLVNGAEGRHYFSRNFDEHIRAAGLYVKGN
ncbi:MAG: endolytic transglycosylase MltG [Spirochaetaceae bacterium]|nr:endolytic transglycosylase MltG [Spirochaetaceae bacterium]